MIIYNQKETRKQNKKGDKKMMTKEEMAKAILNMNDEDFRLFKEGINQITFEYGWGGNLDDSDFIMKIWKKEEA